MSKGCGDKNCMWCRTYLEEGDEDLLDIGVETETNKKTAKEKFNDLHIVDGVVGPRPLYDEASRTYTFATGDFFTIANPLALYYRDGGSSHRIVDQDGVVYLIPFPVFNQKPVILSWVPRPGTPAVAF